jgi:hypothetical protein
MAGGQQITSGQGTVTAGKGDAVSGEEATAAAGSPENLRQHRLNSRKVGGGSATHAISGQAITSAFGLFTPVPEKAATGQVAALFGGTLGRERSMPLTGSASTVSAGSVTASGSSIGALTSMSFSLTTTAASGTYPFTVGVPMRKGDAASIQTNLTNYQVVVMSRWSDNTIKHAIVSGRAALTQNVARTVAVSIGTPQTGVALSAASIQAAAPTASVQCGSIGTVSLASLLASPFRTYISGHEMVECHYRANVASSLLSVWFHVRLYADGRMWVRAICENGYLDNGSGAAAANADQSYTATVIVGGTTVYTVASITHYKNTRWMAEGWIGGNPAITALHDVAYLKRTKLVPNYGTSSSASYASTSGQTTVASGANVVTTLAGIAQTYTPMSRGDIAAEMFTTGFAPQIGLLPLWDALYLSSGDVRAARSVAANSGHLSSYMIVWRSRSTNLPPRPSDFPTWTYTGPNGSGAGTQELNAGGNYWEQNHHGSGGYLAYLLTGDYWHYETMALQAATVYVAISSARGSGVNRVLRGVAQRGIAWAFRTLGQYVAVAPTGDAVAADYRTLLENNVTTWANEGPNNASASQLGWPVALSTYDPAQPLSQAPWMQNFWIAATGYLSDIEPGFGSTTNLTALRDWMYKGVVGMLGATGSTNHYYTKASSYNITISADVVAFFSVTTPDRFYANWGQVYTATYGGTNNNTSAVLEGTSGSAPGAASIGYWGNLLPAIAYAVDHSADGASAAWTRLTSANNWPAVAGGQNITWEDAPLWGVTPRVTTPAWRSSMAARTWKKIGANTLDSLNPDNNPALNPNYPATKWRGNSGFSSIITAWNGGAFNRLTNTLRLNGGGHADWSGNEMYDIDISAENPTWVMARAPSGAIGNLGSLNDGNEGSNVYFDGRPRSAHSYNNLVWVGREFYNLLGSQYITGDSGSRLFRHRSDWESLGIVGFGAASQFAGICYDSLRNQLVMSTTTNVPLRTFNLSTGAFASTSKSHNIGSYQRLVYVPTHDVVVVLNDNYTNRFSIYDFGRTAASALPQPPVNGTIPGTRHQTGEWVPSLGAVVCWSGGTGFDLLTPPASGNPATTAWTWSRLEASASNTVSPDAPTANGVWGRFFHSPDLRVLGVINGTTQQINVFALD